MYVSKRKRRKRIIRISLIILGFFLLIILLALSPVGNSVVKSVIQSKIQKYVPQSRVNFLDYDFKNFSVVFIKGDNDLKVIGEMFPLNAIVEGDFKDLSQLNSRIKGKATLNSRLYTKNGMYVLNGLISFAKGILDFDAKYNKNLIFNGRGSGFSIPELLYMVNINYPWLKGYTDINISNYSGWKLKLSSKGVIKKYITFPFKATSEVKLKTLSDMIFTTSVISNETKAEINGKYYNGYIKARFKIKDLNITRFGKYLLYPVQAESSFDGIYESKDNILKFSNDKVEGFVQNGKIEINFKMKCDDFFRYLNMKRFLKGTMTGNIKITKEGVFDIINSQPVIIKSFYTNKIKKLTGIDLSKEKLGNIFLKGTFDSQKAEFESLSKNSHISLSIKNGVYRYDGKFKFVLFLSRKDAVYKLLIQNHSVKLLSKKIYKQYSDKVLVF